MARPHRPILKEVVSGFQGEVIITRFTLFDEGPGGQTSSHRRVFPPSGSLKGQFKVSGPAARFLPKIVKMYATTKVFLVLYEVQTISKPFQQEYIFFKTAVHQKFFRNLTSNSSRSTLTSIDEIRVDN
jgi:hypothetical protein